VETFLCGLHPIAQFRPAASITIVCGRNNLRESLSGCLYLSATLAKACDTFRWRPLGACYCYRLVSASKISYGVRRGSRAPYAAAHRCGFAQRTYVLVCVPVLSSLKSRSLLFGNSHFIEHRAKPSVCLYLARIFCRRLGKFQQILIPSWQCAQI
jgi:hypothetical protein